MNGKKTFEQLLNPKEIKIGKKTYYTSTIPAFFAQRIMLAAGPALGDLDVSKLPESVILDILSYCAVVNENGVGIVLDDIDIINMSFDKPTHLIELEMKEIEENFGFFFDGSLREVFRPLMELIKKSSETSTP